MSTSQIVDTSNINKTNLSIKAQEIFGSKNLLDTERKHIDGFESGKWNQITEYICKLKNNNEDLTIKEFIDLSWVAGYWLAKVPVSDVFGWYASNSFSKAIQDELSSLVFNKKGNIRIPLLQNDSLINSDGFNQESTVIKLVPFGSFADNLLLAIPYNKSEIKIAILDLKNDGVYNKEIQTLFSNASSDITINSEVWGGIKEIGTVNKSIFKSVQMCSMLLEVSYLGGALQACLDMTCLYVKERHQFGKPLGTLQSVQHTLADVAAEISGIRESIIYAQDIETTEKEFLLRAALVNNLVKKVGSSIGSDCMHLFGGVGFLRDGPIENYYRAIKQLSLQNGGIESSYETLDECIL